MKKRLVTLVAAMVLTLSMGMTAFAAESPVVDDTPYQEGYATSATTTVGGVAVALDFTYNEINIIAQSTAAQQAELLKFFDAESKAAQDAYVKTLFETVTGYTSSTDANKAPFVKDFFSLELPAGTTMPAEGIDITIEAPYASAGDSVWFLLHLKDDGTWEFIKTTAGNGTLTGRFTSLSPVYVICAQDAKAPAAAGTTGTAATTATKTATTTTAPKTGEFAGIYVAGMFALISAAGILVYTKRRKTVR
ncbi:LPXTG cell wall anchor domain-containing protein [Roseburia sp. 499]|uniref:LPXTG cell wall anchor domain-containing protein n=1 Tax=Roseburia sp. 499 TaxID=1261634 RepID=UPI000951C3BA|nr:LPXTG cell wall anchor domain-containing protein [Roseburia sp. 499]WVK69272.1 LPXTG cell wall anchor domain-containing protein [Roseburia sp. 499]